MLKSQKKELIFIILGAIVLAAAIAVSKIFPNLPTWAEIIIFIVPYLMLGGVILYDAVHGLFGKQFMDENFLMSAASIGAFCVGEYVEAILVMLLYRIGELLEKLAVGKSRASIAELMNICPESATVITEEGETVVEPDEVHIDDIILVKAGERIPLDGVIIEGSSNLNTSALTGESLPVDVSIGDFVSSGCINLRGALKIRVEREYADSTVSRMLELIEGAAANKSKSEDFITKFAKWYTPSIIGLVILLAIVPPAIFGQDWDTWIYRALTFLVISCPCALVISVPMTFFGGIGGASKRGILVKGSNYMEVLSKCGTVVFDKTGTLTKGTFKIKKLIANGVTENELLMYSAACEKYSNHPLARCVVDAYGECDAISVTDVEEIAGNGVRAKLNGHIVCCGNARFMKSIGADYPEIEEAGTLIFTALDEKCIGCIVIADEVKENAKFAVDELHGMNMETVMLTGDRKLIGEDTAKQLGIRRVHTQLLPEDKVSHIEEFVKNKKGNVAFVGDGINDAPVLARADVGIAMGGLGSDAAIEAADIVIMDDNIEKVPLAVRFAKRTVWIAWQNILLALIVKFIVLVLGALGYTEMWMALIADVGVCLAAVLNAMRALNIKQEKINKV